jgi:5-methylcytosine-specific restriction protein A
MLDKQPRAAAEYEATRNATVARKLYHSGPWRVLRRAFLAEFPRCSSVGCTRPSEVVDHIQPHHGNHTLFFSRSNLQPLCKRCHDSKTVRRDGGFGNQPAAPSKGSDDDELFIV